MDPNTTANLLWLATSTLSFLLVLNEWFAWSSCASNSLVQALYYFFCPSRVPGADGGLRTTTNASSASSTTLASLGLRVLNPSSPLVTGVGENPAPMPSILVIS